MADYNSAFTGLQIDAGVSKANTAVQPTDLATVATTGEYADLVGLPTLAAVATSGAYTDLSGLPTLGTASAEDVGAFATAAQGALADSAVQPAEIADFVSSNPTGVTGADTVTNMMSLTQAEYDAIVTPNASTLYVITG